MAGNPDPKDYGWTLMEVTQHSAEYHRWGKGLTRQELHIVYDGQGNLYAWSVWENTRVSIDQETGRRHRLNKFLSQAQDDSVRLG